MPSLNIKGGLDGGRSLAETLQLHRHGATFGAVPNLVSHPACPTHSHLSPAEQMASGVRPGRGRRSVGPDNLAAIVNDWEQGSGALAL